MPSTSMVFLPPTTNFPPNSEALSREDLNGVYLELRNCYKSLMISRGQFRSRAGKARNETAMLKQNLLDLASREASVRTDIYQMLEIVTAIAGDLEDAGDDLVNEFARYKMGCKTYQGGSFIRGLVQAVIRFINRWSQTKERVVQLDQKRQEFIEKTKDLQALSQGGAAQGGSVSQAEPTSVASVEIVGSPADQQAREVKSDGTTH
jgi:hypothetical protein